MERWRRAAVALAAALGPGACGGLVPVAATGVLPAAVRITAGDTGAPVSGAQVTIGGQTYASGADGGVLLADEPHAIGSPVRVSTTGFLPRETVLPGAAGALSLWPLRADYSDAYVRSLLYLPSDATATSPAAGDHGLYRVTAPRVSIVPSREIREDAEKLAIHRQAVALLNDATAGAVVFTLDLRPMAAVAFHTSIDPSVRDGAFTHRELDGNTITGGTIVFSERPGFEPARDIRYVAHELGHALGLEHSIDPADMMYFAVLSGSPPDFSERERLTIRLLLQRSPGNRYPDRDPHVG